MIVFAVFAAVIGAIIGSFLNVCIHRMPLGIPLGNPKRSFCPNCKRTIPWYENIPIASWLLLGGKCKGCGIKISPRYLFVEALTAVAFLAAWQKFLLPLAPIYWIFLSLLIVATFIDIKHFIIPDEITIGGTVCGLLAAAAVPALMDTTSRWESLAWSAVGAVVGGGLLFIVVELGKLAFGKKRHVFEPAEPLSLIREENMETLVIGDEKLKWEEIFSRPSDVLTIEGTGLKLNGEEIGGNTIKFRHDCAILNGQQKSLVEVTELTGSLTAIVIPREAMGLGDVKFLAMIGAFLGWKAVLFAVCASSVIGTLAALAGFLLAKDRSGVRLPYGPYLALGAAIWVFGGNLLWEWYFSRLGGGGNF
jgi:leader peptidase (prepilin peptidase)/N-methyltransferase